MNFEKYVAAAKLSTYGLWKLNLGLSQMIPFNRPHGIKVKRLEDDRVTTIIPYKRKNRNHIRGIHACGLATCAEFSSGLLLITKLDARKYRLIMESLEMKYLYQAKTDVTAEFEISDDWIDETVIEPLKLEEQVLVNCEINLYDTEKNHIAIGRTNWQIKDWNQVKTKL